MPREHKPLLLLSLRPRNYAQSPTYVLLGLEPTSSHHTHWWEKRRFGQSHKEVSSRARLELWPLNSLLPPLLPHLGSACWPGHLQPYKGKPGFPLRGFQVEHGMGSGPRAWKLTYNPALLNSGWVWFTWFLGWSDLFTPTCKQKVLASGAPADQAGPAVSQLCQDQAEKELAPLQRRSSSTAA